MSPVSAPAAEPGTGITVSHRSQFKTLKTANGHLCPTFALVIGSHGWWECQHRHVVRAEDVAEAEALAKEHASPFDRLTDPVTGHTCGTYLRLPNGDYKCADAVWISAFHYEPARVEARGRADCDGAPIPRVAG